MDFKEAAKELGKRGGTKTLQEHGKDHFRKMKLRSDEAKRAKKMIQSDTVEANSNA